MTTFCIVYEREGGVYLDNKTIQCYKQPNSKQILGHTYETVVFACYPTGSANDIRENEIFPYY